MWVRSMLNAAAVCALLAGCGSVPPALDPRSIDLSEMTAAAKRYEQAALASGDPTQRSVYQYMAAQAWYDGGFPDRAYTLLQAVDPERLSKEQWLTYALMRAAYYRSQNEPAQALALLEAVSMASILAEAEDELKHDWARETGNLSLQLGNYEQAFRAYDLALSSSSAGHRAPIRDSFWKCLTLSDEVPDGPYLSEEIPGWIALARINRSSGTASDQYLAYLLWQDQFYDHPANTNPPDSFLALKKIAAGERPNVAVLLPMTGSLATAGQAVLDGYLAARAQEYAASSQSPEDPLAPARIRIFDTATTELRSILRQIAADDIDLIIGPLERTRVAEFAHLVPADVPALALNSLENDPGTAEKALLGLSLNVENESVQAAVRALQHGHRNAMILVPRSSWGDRAGAAFADFWRARGGDIVEYRNYGDSTNHADILEDSLHVDHSNERVRSLQAALGKALDFTPRRRQDIDALFMAASPDQARQLKPMLAFFFAEDIPVYSTSSVYSGWPDSSADRDLNGIQFSTLPWILDTGSDLRGILAGDEVPSATELKMQAIGVDSYFLSQRITQLLTAPDTVYRGVLGTLGKNPDDSNLDRRQIWAEFRGGLARPVEN